MRNHSVRVMLAAAAVAAAPAVLAAQQTTVDTTTRPVTQAVMDTTVRPPTHTVVKGETLWELAQRYLNNPFLWPEILDLNKTMIADPHWIYPGQVFNLPGAVSSVSVAVSGFPPVDTMANVAPPMTVTVDTAALPTMALDSTQPPPEPSVNTATAPTVFKRAPETAPTTTSVASVAPPEPTVAKGRYLAAPYVVQTGTLKGAGQVIRSADLDALGNADSRRMFKAYDNVLLQTPAGMTLNPGDRLMVVKRGPSLRGLGDVIIPTGVILVTHAAEGDADPVGQVVKLYGEMTPGQLLVPADTADLSSTARPEPIADGPWASIKWVLSDPVLPTVQNYAVLDITSADGVKPGDMFQVFRAADTQKKGEIPGLPEVVIGTAQAIRVTAYGTTVMITTQRQPSINVGARVRVSARMP
ncbi:MAG TPA: LysM peptidoglycan-binding domain-containing protein [Gemmatimonadaceae bacterium]|jgi:LysM repeat protein|nr:LysM peptidoglycan-binding domain-containing protein [Gemmatimonadaceae bacterium]